MGSEMCIRDSVRSKNGLYFFNISFEKNNFTKTTKNMNLMYNIELDRLINLSLEKIEEITIESQKIKKVKIIPSCNSTNFLFITKFINA